MHVLFMPSRCSYFNMVCTIHWLRCMSEAHGLEQGLQKCNPYPEHSSTITPVLKTELVPLLPLRMPRAWVHSRTFLLPRLHLRTGPFLPKKHYAFVCSELNTSFPYSFHSLFSKQQHRIDSASPHSQPFWFLFEDPELWPSVFM